MGTLNGRLGSYSPAGVHERLVAGTMPDAESNARKRIADGRRAAHLEREGLFHVIHGLEELAILCLRAEDDGDEVAFAGVRRTRQSRPRELETAMASRSRSPSVARSGAWAR